MENNQEYGGFIVSKNIISGSKIRYVYREKSNIPQFNGWTMYSIDDNESYINNSENFAVLNAESLFKLSPVMKEIFYAPYGTDLCFSYVEDTHVGFYDLAKNEETDIQKIIQSDNVIKYK